MGAEIWCFWPLTASTTLEVKNDHAHVITQDIWNKFIEIKFCVECLVCPWLHMLDHQLPVKLLIRHLFSYLQFQEIFRLFQKSKLTCLSNNYIDFSDQIDFESRHYSKSLVWWCADLKNFIFWFESVQPCKNKMHVSLIT